MLSIYLLLFCPRKRPYGGTCLLFRLQVIALKLVIRVVVVKDVDFGAAKGLAPLWFSRSMAFIPIISYPFFIVFLIFLHLNIPQNPGIRFLHVHQVDLCLDISRWRGLGGEGWSFQDPGHGSFFSKLHIKWFTENRCFSKIIFLLPIIVTLK